MASIVDNTTCGPLQTIVERESLLLAAYAQRSVDSKGRKYPEPDHPYRGPFQRDRDRILHSAAYRRLSGKMQVFTGDMGDYHRTRLTHTQEVASIARTIGRALRLNEDLIEALALFHDIGHPPFGHAGEFALNECLAGDGGFCHNQHALTLVEQLESGYQEFPGLNLTREVLDGQTTRVATTRTMSGQGLEVQVVDAADSITYNAHDTDDAVKLRLVTLDELAQIPLIAETLEAVRQRPGPWEEERLRKAVVHGLIDRQVGDLLEHTAARLSRVTFASAEQARAAAFSIQQSEKLAAEKRELEAFLYERVYRHPRLMEIRHAAQVRIRIMFEALLKRPELLPARFQQRIEQVGQRRSAAEYLAGMTDRFCDQQYHHFT